MNKVVINMRVAVHRIQADLWDNREYITPGMSLREIGKLIGVEEPQKVKHHLEMLVKMGAIDYIGGQYVFIAKYDEEHARYDEEYRNEQK